VGSEEGEKCGTDSLRGGVVGAAVAHTGGGGSGRSGFRRKKRAGRLTGRAHLLVKGRRRGRIGWKGEEERWAAAGPEIGYGQIQEIKSFRILFEIWIFGKLLKFAQGDSEGILTWGFFLKSSRLLKDF
jgi:hypothetical protein